MDGRKIDESTPLHGENGIHFNNKSMENVQIGPQNQEQHDPIGNTLSSSESPEKKQENNFKFSDLPTRAKLNLIFCVIAMFLASCSLSIIGPFYPIVADRKRMSIAIIGWVFAVYQIAIFVTTPVFGTYLTKIGPKFVYIGGLFVGGAVNIIFGLLDKCPDGEPFIILSIICRIFMGFGFSGFLTASFAIVASECPRHVGFTFGLLETGAGLGYLVGPLIGGVLYEYGGYGTPFFVLGSAVLLLTALMTSFMPPVGEIDASRKGSMLYLLKSGSVVISLLVLFCGSMGIVTWEVTLAQHLVPFHLNTAIVGLLFCITAGAYSVIAPLYGYVSDTKDIQAPIIVPGVFMFGIGFLFLGPSRIFSFLPFKLWTIIIGLAMNGLTLGTTLVPTMKCMVNGAVELGYDNNMDTYGLVSGLYNAVLTFAGFVGPIVSTEVVAAYDIAASYTLVGCLSILAAIISMIYFVSKHYKQRNVNVSSYQRL